jgi:hypothetical protein
MKKKIKSESPRVLEKSEQQKGKSPSIKETANNSLICTLVISLLILVDSIIDTDNLSFSGVSLNAVNHPSIMLILILLFVISSLVFVVTASIYMCNLYITKSFKFMYIRQLINIVMLALGIVGSVIKIDILWVYSEVLTIVSSVLLVYNLIIMFTAVLLRISVYGSFSIPVEKKESAENTKKEEIHKNVVRYSNKKRVKVRNIK